MAVRNEIVLCVKWVSDKDGNRPDFTTPANCSWEDITGQPANLLPCKPNVYLIRAFVTDAVFTAINGDARFIVLARKRYDDQTPDVVISNTFDDKPTAAQLTTLKNLIIERFPWVDEDALTDAGKAILETGITREAAIRALAKRWQKFVKALKQA